MKKFKKIIAMCLTAAMALSMMSVGAFAAEEDVFVTKTESVIEEYEITNPELMQNDGMIADMENAEVLSYVTIDGVEVPYEYKLSEEVANDNGGIMPIAQTVYETEVNNDINSSDRIYDDNNVYGTISYNGDEDWFVVSFGNIGAVNFWLGSVPTNCDYDIYVYEQNGTVARMVAYSANYDNADELISEYTCLANTNYFIQVVGNGTYSNQMYLLRTRMQ